MALSGAATAACCYFAALDKDVTPPAQRAFISWDEKEKTEAFTVQAQFQGNADEFGIVIPSPSKPKLQEMPKDFFNGKGKKVECQLRPESRGVCDFPA